MKTYYLTSCTSNIQRWFVSNRVYCIIDDGKNKQLFCYNAALKNWQNNGWLKAKRWRRLQKFEQLIQTGEIREISESEVVLILGFLPTGFYDFFV